MATNGTEPRSGRETRLLILVVGVSIALLLLLARIRFPSSDLTAVTPSAAPLAGLAARATFDEMANTMADVLGRVSPLVVVVHLAPVPVEADPRPSARKADDDEPAADAVAAAASARPMTALAVRVRRDMALVYVPDGFTPQSAPDMTIDVAAHDPSREMMLVRVVATTAAPDTLSASVRTFPSFSYVAAIDSTPVGPTIQPTFIGRADSVIDPRWSHPLVPASVGPGLTPGVWVFGLNGRLAGLVARTEAGPMIVPAPALETLVQALEAGGTAP